MAARKKAPGTAPAPKPDLTASAVVTVFVRDDGTALVDLKVDVQGHDALTRAMVPASAKLNIAGVALRRVVMGTLAVKTLTKPADLLPVARRALRA